MGLQWVLKKPLWLHLRISVGLQPHEKSSKFKGLQPRVFLHMLPDGLFPQPVKPR